MAVQSYTGNNTSAVVARSVFSSASESTQMVEEVLTSASQAYDLRKEIRLTERDFKLFLVSLNSDEEPNEKLRALATDTSD